MSKRMKLLVSVLVAILLLTVGGVATVMADEGSTSTSNTTGTKGLQARVAEILGITQEDMNNAFEQAQQEMREEALSRYREKAVGKGGITPGQFNRIREWRQQRLKAVDRPAPPARILQATRNRQQIAVPRGWHQPVPPELVG